MLICKHLSKHILEKTANFLYLEQNLAPICPKALKSERRQGLTPCHLSPQQHRAASHPHLLYATIILSYCHTIKLSNYQTTKKWNFLGVGKFDSLRVGELDSLTVGDEGGSAARCCWGSRWQGAKPLPP